MEQGQKIPNCKLAKECFFCRLLRKIIRFFLFTSLSGVVLMIAMNAWVVRVSKPKILDSKQVEEEHRKRKFDYIVVLGAAVRGKEPSPMLKERIDSGVKAFELVEVPLLMSGDSSKTNYRETAVMKQKAMEAGIPEAMIVEDHFGISTYDSIWRLHHLFQGKKVLVITQKYHLHRAIYLARRFGMEAFGMDAQVIRYSGQNYRELREFGARIKDFFLGFLQPKAKFEK